MCRNPLSTEFSRQEYWSGLPSLPPGNLPNAGTKPPSLASPASPALAGGFFTTNITWEAACVTYKHFSPNHPIVVSLHTTCSNFATIVLSR